MFNITQTNITIMVNDMATSIAFYTEALGFTILQQYGNYYAQVSAPGIIIGLHPSGKKINPSESISIGFTTDDFDAVKNQLDKFAVKHAERKEEGGDFIHFSDPDGTALYFINPKK
jgi:catechol 2,3-dioxygenase-like lactoylglutathione lyase family enzyme